VRLWAALAQRPRLYRPLLRAGVGVLALLGRRRGGFARLAGAAGWTAARDLPAPPGGTFVEQWHRRRRGGAS
jgi:L-lactate dehydrogenase complex protein LldF